jgi:lipopolysaccharide/colanic/teichoic acid biosynthesis glycosyltransferase
MALPDVDRSHNTRLAQKPTLHDLVARYHWQRIWRIRMARHARFFVHRSLWIVRVTGYPTVKRAMDLAGAIALISFLSPLLVLVALAIKLSDGGEVLFWQNRIGFRGTVFACPKFRSMVPHADRIISSVAQNNHHGNSITFKMKHDPRVTWVGRGIRRCSIDELPQLWCILRGGMTLVGPRPALPREVSRYRLAERRRLDVKPGLTCIWQVEGRGDLPFSRQVELDVQYIESQTLLLDLKLLLMTVPAVLSGRGAY